MKKSKILSLILVLAIFFVTAVPMTAFAADDASITINKPDNLSIDEQTFSAYKVFDVTTHVSGDQTSYSYTIADEFSGASTLLDSFVSDPDAADMMAIASDLWDYINANSIQPTGSATAGTDAQSVTIGNLPYGYYLVYGSGVADGDQTVYGVSSLTTAAPDVTIDPKMDAPFINKEVFNHNTNTWTDWTDINIGDTAEFKLNSRVPVMTGYESYTYTVYDEMSAGLTFNDDVVVKINDAELDPSYYDVDITSAIPGEATIFEIVFDPDMFVTLTENATIEITYSGVLNEYAVISVPGNPNKVYLEYSNDPYDTGEGGSTGETPEYEVIVYTFDIEIYKYTGDLSADEDEALEGAEFELRVGDEDGNVVRVVALENDADGYNYRLATSEDAAADITTVLRSNAAGTIKIKGLDAGEYVLIETKAPDGFNKLEGWKTIVIIHKDEAGAYEMTVDADPSNVVNVQNNSGTELPGTGGIGTTIFYVISAILTAGLAVFFISRRKKNLLDAK